MRCFNCNREMGAREGYWSVLSTQKIVLCKFCAPTLEEVNKYVCELEKV